MSVCNALLSSPSCCPLGSQKLVTLNQPLSLSETCLCNKNLCQDEEISEEDAVDPILINQAIDEIKSCMSYYHFSGKKLTNISGNGGLRGDRICEETKEVFDGPIKCPAGTPSGEFKNTQIR